MKERLSARWQKVPRTVRRPVVLTVGLFFVLLSGALGWLPGPGGIPLFLLGIAILSSEFHWAKRIKIYILHLVHTLGSWMRSHRTLSTIFILMAAVACCAIVYMLLQFK